MHKDYKVKLDLLEAEAASLPRDRAVLWISVGGGYNFVGQRLAAWTRWAKTNFREVWLDIADTDKATNLTAFDGLPPEQAHTTARRIGDDWLAANVEIVTKIPADHIIRFDDWSSRPDFKPVRAALQSSYETQSEFRAAVDVEATSYAVKRGKPEAASACADYILNELAACSLRAATLQAVCLYPGAQKQPFALIRDGLVPGAPKLLRAERYAAVSIR